MNVVVEYIRKRIDGTSTLLRCYREGDITQLHFYSSKQAPNALWTLHVGRALGEADVYESCDKEELEALYRALSGLIADSDGARVHVTVDRTRERA